MNSYNERFKEDMKNYQYMFMFSEESAKLIIDLLREYEKENLPAEDEPVLSEYMKDEIEGQYSDLKKRYEDLWSIQLD